MKSVRQGGNIIHDYKLLFSEDLEKLIVEHENQLKKGHTKKKQFDSLPSIDEVEQLKKHIENIQCIITNPEPDIRKSFEINPSCTSGILIF